LTKPVVAPSGSDLWYPSGQDRKGGGPAPLSGPDCGCGGASGSERIGGLSLSGAWGTIEWRVARSVECADA